MLSDDLPSFFIIGAGRNGTSMTAGLFHKTGYFQGDHLHAPQPENPKGYFESAPINQLNNRILSRYVPGPEKIGGITYRADAPGTGNGWLARLPLDQQPVALDAEKATIAAHLARQPFCLKDTRFCYLLHIWRSFAPATVRMICVFRRPEVAVASVLKSLRTRPGLFDSALSVNQAFELWTLQYTHVLERHAQTGHWFFVQYEDLLDGTAFEALQAFTGMPLDLSFPDHGLNRTVSGFSAPAAAEDVFARLREKANDSL